MGTKIMLIDDDPSMQLLIQEVIEREAWEFCCASNGAEGLEMLRRENPSFLILDVMLPDTNGFDICRIIREEGRRVPIMFLSAKGDIVDKSVGFNAGADDYLVKPFQNEELVLRIKAHLRRRDRAIAGSVKDKASGSYKTGDLEVFFGKYEVQLRGEPVALSSREFELLAILAADPGSVFTREQIIDEMGGSDAVTDPNTITVLVRKIREKIEKDPAHPQYLQTVWRVGYKLADHVM